MFNSCVCKYGIAANNGEFEDDWNIIVFVGLKLISDHICHAELFFCHMKLVAGSLSIYFYAKNKPTNKKYVCLPALGEQISNFYPLHEGIGLSHIKTCELLACCAGFAHMM